MPNVTVLLERTPYRYVEVGTLDNGFPDYRIQKQHEYTKRYSVIYNQVLKHYEEKGVDFYGDVDEDYDILLTKLENDLFYYEPSESSS